ncbi:nuclear transport factor 2 family protein [Mycobacterium sp. 4D054]|uniref:nuclear transport factor 2 family protein n=1 Tax=unclassified Mycobacterium TaxID=2642494 RepID=UPI0021B306D0|nr:nuclear transport factor 2 family protein [Mycobacterium sp. SMC-8]UXA14098.1 nuclear transport factor 2 family protein [Mycobacterium sp. SMC-8]
MTTSELATVLAWHDALNAGEVDTLLELSSDDIEIGHAGGAAQGHAALRHWAEALDERLEPGRIYVHDGVVVVEQQTVSVTGETGSAAAAFRVVHDKVTSVFRHPGLAAALAATELTEADLTG